MLRGYLIQTLVVGHGGSLVDSAPFVQIVAGSNPTIEIA